MPNASSRTNPPLAAARSLTSAGISVLPVHLQTKRPVAHLLPRGSDDRPSWEPYQHEIADANTLARWFATPGVGLAIVCGRVSGNLELLDFDHHPPEHPQAFSPWAELVAAQAPGLVERLVVLGTQRGGRHVPYRAPAIAGNQKLASYPITTAAGRPGSETWIETRGEGGYALVAPTAGYRVLQGDLLALPTLNASEREILLSAARCFSELAAPVTGEQGQKLREPGGGEVRRPGDDYNAGVSLEEVGALLARHGWTCVHGRGSVTYWRRPGKDLGGASATLNHVPNRFYVFSSNAYPFEPGRAYDPFAIYTLLEHRGDWRAASRALGHAGYGEPPDRRAAARPGPGTREVQSEGEGSSRDSSLENLLARLAPVRAADGGKPERAAVERLAADLVGAAAALSKADQLRLTTALRELGLTQEDLRHWRSAVTEVRGAGRQAAVGDLPDAAPYEADADHIYRVTSVQAEDGPRQSREVVADFAAHIVEEITGEDGARTYVIAGRSSDGRSFRVELAAEKFADDGALVAALDAAAGAYAPVRAKMGAHLRPAIKLLSRAAGQVQQGRRYERTGWADGRFLIPGREPEAVQIRLPPKLAYRIEPTAGLERGLAALRQLLVALEPEITTVALAALFTGPLARLAGWGDERYSLFICGPTGSLKTTFVQTAMCIWGDFASDNRLLKFGEGATRNALMHYATRAHDLPLFIDNYKPSTGDGAGGFVSLIHNLTEGADRDRLQRSHNELRSAGEIRCWPIFTGEDVPADDPATLARLLIVRFRWEARGENGALAAGQAEADLLSAVGAAFLAWLESPAGRQAAETAGRELGRRRGAWRERLYVTERDAINPGRIAANLAINELTFTCLAQHPALGSVFAPHRSAHQRGLVNIAADMAGRSRGAREAVRFVRALAELLANGQCVLDTKGRPPSDVLPERRIGWRDPRDGSCYLLPHVARRQALRIVGPEALGHLSDTALFSQLQEMGLLAGHDEGRLLRKVRVTPGEPAQWVLHLSARALSSAADQDEREPPA